MKLPKIKTNKDEGGNPLTYEFNAVGQKWEFNSKSKAQRERKFILEHKDYFSKVFK